MKLHKGRTTIASLCVALLYFSFIATAAARAQSLGIRYGIGFVHVREYNDGTAYLSISFDPPKETHIPCGFELNGWLGGKWSPVGSLTFAGIELALRLRVSTQTPLGELSLNMLPGAAYIISDSAAIMPCTRINEKIRDTGLYFAFSTGVSLEQQFLQNIALTEDYRYQIIPSLSSQLNRFISVGVRIHLRRTNGGN